MANTLQELSDAMAAAVESVAPGIVRVEGRRRLPATGIVWNNDGVIVTAHHVIERDDDIHIGLQDGTVVTASLVGRDPNNDIAVLKAGGNLAAVPLAESDAPKVGHLVMALGRPGAEVFATLGVVSAVVDRSWQPGHDHGPEDAHEHHGHEHRHEEHERRKKRRGPRPPRGPRGSRRGGWRWGRALADGFIQTDVVMYPGFSGGPLLSGYGTVYGMNTSGFARGASLAVPISTLRSSVTTLLAHGRVRQGYLGVGVQPAKLPGSIAEELDRETGVLVVSVEADSPAEQAGILVGDILVAIGEETVEEVDELLASLTGELVGQTVPVQLVRGGQLQQMDVTVGERA